MTPEQYCQDKAARSGSSFYYSFFFLPKNQRKAITALYAFCREVDDIVDSDMEEHIARRKLQWWRDEIQRLFQLQPQHPVTRALLPHIKTMNLPEEYFMEIIDGMEMDLDQVQYDTFEALSLYCYRVASVVGLLSAEIFGYQDRQTLNYAHNLGIAFQLTNIIRDVHEDASRGRLYLPTEDIERFGLTRNSILQKQDSEQFRQLLAFEATRAQEYYQKAYGLLPASDRYSQRCGLMMAAIYQATLMEVANDGFAVLKHRIVLTPVRKFWLALKTYILELWNKLFRHGN
ncbi:MAG: presqualene diphosphate synthase HpnD [Thioalkalispiraceae bacterium]|jgi:phytoene synthase